MISWFKRLWKRPERLTPQMRYGRWGEAQAARYLRQQGYRIIGQNVRSHRHGEIDIIARTEDDIIFVEVKSRRDENYARPADAVNAKKRRHLKRAITSFLMRANKPPLGYRCDIIEVVGLPEVGTPIIRHLKGSMQLLQPTDSYH